MSRPPLCKIAYNVIELLPWGWKTNTTKKATPMLSRNWQHVDDWLTDNLPLDTNSWNQLSTPYEGELSFFPRCAAFLPKPAPSLAHCEFGDEPCFHSITRTSTPPMLQFAQIFEVGIWILSFHLDKRPDKSGPTYCKKYIIPPWIIQGSSTASLTKRCVFLLRCATHCMNTRPSSRPDRRLSRQASKT